MSFNNYEFLKEVKGWDEQLNIYKFFLNIIITKLQSFLLLIKWRINANRFTLLKWKLKS